MKRILLVLLLGAGWPGPVLAQSAPAGREQSVRVTPSPPLVKYGKWALVGVSVAMNLLAREAHQEADQAYEIVLDACAVDRNRCTTLSNGQYADPALESAYQRALDYDGKARRWLVAGQTALVGAAVGFIWELTRPKGRPDNIPFEPEVGQQSGATTVGFRVSF